MLLSREERIRLLNSAAARTHRESTRKYILDCRHSMLWEEPFKKVVCALDYLLSLAGSIKLKLRLDKVPLSERQISTSGVQSEDSDVDEEANARSAERIARAPGLIAKLLTSIDKRFSDKRVSFILKANHGDLKMEKTSKHAFDFIEFFCTIREQTPNYILKSLVVRNEQDSDSTVKLWGLDDQSFLLMLKHCESVDLRNFIVEVHSDKARLQLADNPSIADDVSATNNSDSEDEDFHPEDSERSYGHDS